MPVENKIMCPIAFCGKNVKSTSEGGIAVKLINKTGSPTIKGQVLEASSSTDNAFDITGISDTHPMGIVLDSGISDGSPAWVVITGTAYVLIDAGGCTHGDRLITSATPGSADVSNSPATAEHFQEIGHSLEIRVGSGLAKTVLHFL